jgi:hypothetical protein
MTKPEGTVSLETSVDVTQLTAFEERLDKALKDAGIENVPDGIYKKINEETKSVVLQVDPIPKTLTDVFSELDEWEQRYHELKPFCEHPDYYSDGARARESALMSIADQIEPENMEEMHKWYNFMVEDVAKGGTLYDEELEKIENRLFEKLKPLVERLVTQGNTKSPSPSTPHTVTPGNTRQRVLEIKSNPETANWSLAMIAKELGVSRPTIHKHIHKLKAAGHLL